MKELARLPSMIEIARATAQHFSLPVSLIRGSATHHSAVHARHVAMFLCRVDGKKSYPEIGEFFGRDHTTVLAADRKVFRMRESGDEQLEYDLKSVRHVVKLVMGLGDPGCPDCRSLQGQMAQLRLDVQVLKQENMALRVRFGCD